MKIISWNVNGVRACIKKGMWDYINEQAPDVFCLQELKAFEEQVTELWPEDSGFYEVWNSAEKPGYSGTGTYSADKLKSQMGMGDKAIDKEGRVIQSDLGKAWLVNTYFPNGAASEERHQFKMRFLDKIIPYLKKLEKTKPVILTGDLNIAHTERDIHDPVRLDGTSGFMPEEREWMDKLVSKGFVDAWRDQHPETAEKYSWWSYRAGARQRNKGWRIDYFMLSEKLAKKVKSVEMHQDITGSDHCPLMMDIQL